MNRKIRVLVVDDSVVIRRLLADAISADPRFELAGVAANGQIALSVLERTHPDAVTLDVEMPVMDGLQALKEIRIKDRRLPVIMFSTLTERCAQTTIDALAMGASDYVTKPANVGSFSAARQQILDSLIPKMLSLCHVSAQGDAHPCSRANIAEAIHLRKPVETQPIEIVAIGSSTGGPNALAAVLKGLPGDLPVPVVITQHMPPAFTRFLAQRLDTCTSLQVREAVAGAVLEAGQVWIAPGDYHLCVVRDSRRVRLALSQSAPENSCRPSVDVLFRSVARAYSGPSVLSVMLTGMGQDGLLGCELLAQAGAQIVVQDEASSVVWGMPGAVARAGLANAIVPQHLISAEILRRVHSSRARKDVALRTAPMMP
ncbi:MAG TPA: chemotaxis response regulator protein-glutamate methylesterase [Terriglobales bacterium]